MNAEQYGQRWGVSKKTAAQWCRDGRIPAVKVGKEWQIDPAAADAVLPEAQDGRQPRRATAPDQSDPAPIAPPTDPEPNSEPNSAPAPAPAAAPAAATAPAPAAAPAAATAAAPAPIPPATPPASRSSRKAAEAASSKPAGPTLADAQRALAVYKAERERLALDQEKKLLVYRADFVTAQNAVAAQIMNRAEALPRQIKQAIPHLLIEEVEKIEALVKEMMEGVANWTYDKLEEGE